MIVAISDLHLDGTGHRLLEVERLVREASAAAGPDGLVLLAGDVTNSGTEEQYDQARWALLPLAGRCALAPGNHDVGWRGLGWSSDSWRRYWDLARLLQVRQEAVQDARWLVLALDTTRHTPSPIDLARGRLGAGERRRLRSAGERARNAGLGLLVLQHHSPWCEDETLLQTDAKSELQILRLARIPVVLVCGHTHHRQDYQEQWGRGIDAGCREVVEVG